MKKIVLALVVLLLLGGGGAGAYFFFMQPAEASIGETDEHQKAADVEEHAEDDGHSSDKFQYVEMDPLILPIIDSEGISQNLSLVIVLEVENTRNKEKVLDYQPRLKDAYIQELYGVLNKQAALEGGVLKVKVIKERLHTISNRVLGEDTVQDVLLQVVQQRPI